MTDATGAIISPCETAGTGLAVFNLSWLAGSNAEICVGASHVTAPNAISLDITATGESFPANLFAPSRLMLETGKTTVLVGASGTGKSTLLRFLAGLEQLPDSISITRMPGDCKRAYMTQNVRLLPWFTVEANVGIAKRLRGLKADGAAVSRVLMQLDLASDAQKHPVQISGGMAQRTALARTLLEDADLNLLDEPFAALDAITRRKMQDLVKAHFTGKTVVMVTHDPAEAVRLADSIFMLSRPHKSAPAAIVPFKPGGGDAAEQLFERLDEG